MSLEGFSALEKNVMMCSQRAALPIQSSTVLSPVKIKMAIWRISFNLTCCVGCWSSLLAIMAVACFKSKKNAPNGHSNLQRTATPDQITQQNSLQRAGAP